MTTAQVESGDTSVNGAHQLLERVILALASAPEAVAIETTSAGDVTTFVVRVARVDVGRVIGDEGRTVQALRMILGAVGLRHKHRFVLEITEI